MKCQSWFLGKIRKMSSKLLSAEFAHRVVTINMIFALKNPSSSVWWCIKFLELLL